MLNNILKNKAAVVAVVCGFLGVILTYLFPSLDLFNGDSKEYQ